MKRSGLVCAAATALCGCWLPPYEPSDPPPRATAVLSTTVESGTILGPGATIQVVADGQGVVRARFGPRMTAKRAVPEAVFQADDFPEGTATMVFTVENSWSELAVEQVHIDRTPPELVRTGGDTLGPGQSFELYVWDAMMLDRVEVTVGEVTAEQHLPRVMATTSLVKASLDVSGIAEGLSVARILLVDAAGNETSLERKVLVDRTSPTVRLVRPAPGAEVSGTLEIAVAASDNLGPVSVELRASGSALAEVAGPLGTMTVDTALFPKGPLTLSAVARDAAGNRSAPATVSVVVR